MTLHGTQVSSGSMRQMAQVARAEAGHGTDRPVPLFGTERVTRQPEVGPEAVNLTQNALLVDRPKRGSGRVRNDVGFLENDRSENAQADEVR